MSGFASVVLVDPALSHLDRAFTYAVPDGVEVSVGSVVRVPFQRRNRVGVVTELLDEPDVGRTLPIRATLGPGLGSGLVDVARWVAARYLSTLGEALAAIVPQRVAGEEEQTADASVDRAPRVPDGPPGGLEAVEAAIDAREHRGIVWRPPVDLSRGEAIAALVARAARGGRGSIVCLPDIRVRSEVASVLREAFGDAAAWLSSDRPARERYRDWLAVRRGEKLVVVGGRAAIFAPLDDLGLVVVDDEGHQSHKEGRAPRFHVRAVAAERARRSAATVLLVGIPPSVEARAATARGSFALVQPARGHDRAERPPVTVVDDATTLVPSSRTLTILARALAKGGRVAILSHRGGEAVERVAERASRILRPGSAAVLDATTPPAEVRRALRRADLVVATPVIAKDAAPSGAGALAIVDADAALAQPEFRSAEDTFATWWRCARWATGGQIVVETRDPAQPAIVALTRWDPEVLARAELARRRELGYPPFASLARIDVPAARADEVAAQIRSLDGVEVLGPAERDGHCVVVARARRRDTLLDALRPVVDEWRRRDEPMRVDVDPWEVFVPKWRS